MKSPLPYRSPAFALVPFAVLLQGLAGCDGSSSPAAGDGGLGGQGGGWGGNGGSSGGCMTGGPQCNNCLDDDGDGKTDYYDPECVGPLDNDERSFATGIPGDNVDPCKQDCFFDGDSGMGNDGCLWELACDPKNPGKDLGCPYDPNRTMCTWPMQDRCTKFCQPITPNGCDCFGCCEVTYTTPSGMTVTESVLLATTCTAASFGDPTKCPRCTQVDFCRNPCEKCEICIGKDTVPADCPRPDGGVPDPDGGAPPPPPPACPAGVVSCGAGGIDPASCPVGTACVTGCCINWVD